MVTVAEEYIAMTRPQTNSERPDPVIQGRFIVDPMQAKEVFGDEVASKLKLSKDGTKILWPQPSDSSNDPQNWSNRRKATQLCVITLAVIVPGLVLGANTNLLFPLAEEFDTSPGEVNNLATNCSFIGSGLGGLFVPLLTRRYGRIPVLAWTQTIFLLALVGCTFAPSFGVFVAMRVLVGVFSVTPQVTGLYVVTDIYPFHLQPRKINIWATGTLVSVWISPFIVGFLATRLYWRWVYGVTCILGSITTLTTIVLGEETLYDRTRILDNEPDTTKLRYRIQTLLGITGWRLSHSRIGWGEGFLGLLKLFSRPHMFAMMVLQGVVLGFGLGIMTTNAILFGSPEDNSFGFSAFAIAGIYGTPVVALLLGELCGRYWNDYATEFSIRRRNGVFEAEDRLWTYYLSIPIYVVGLVVLGISLEKHLHVSGIIMGWGIAQFAIMLSTVAGISYSNDCFPNHTGEVMALTGISWVLGGIGLSYAQEAWVARNGAMETLGIEGGMVAGLALLIIPTLQTNGTKLRARFGM